MMRSHLVATAFLAVASAQRDSSSGINPMIDIATCDSLSCSNDDIIQKASRGVCDNESETPVAYGVGIAPEAVALSDFNDTRRRYSYTLTDGEDWAEYIGQWGYQFSQLNLYYGVATGGDLSSLNPACALLFQYQGQTFPDYTDVPDFQNNATLNTTACPRTFTGGEDNSCLDNLRATIRSFDYYAADSNNISDNTTLTRCEALAQHVQYRSRDLLCSFYGNLVSVTGGTLSGPGAASANANIAWGDGTCQPTIPEDRTMYPVLSAREVLHSADGADFNMGGRAGFTPVVSVVYGDEGSDGAEDPDVQVLCMRTFDPEGGRLPVSRLQYQGQSSGAGTAVGSVGAGWLLTLAAVGLAAFGAW